MKRAASLLRIDARDDVAVALADLDAGDEAVCDGAVVTLREPVARGHKVALHALAEDAPVCKYGAPIGLARRRIEAGEWVHTHNVRTGLSGVLAYAYTPAAAAIAPPPGGEADPPNGGAPARTFDGYVRADGKVGIRNEVWIIPTVGCVNKIGERLAQEAGRRYAGLADGFYAFTHPYGCSQLGEDHRHTQRLLAGLVRHPNAAGVLVLGLGCENNHIGEFATMLDPFDPQRVKFLAVQETDDELEAGLALLGELAEAASRERRQPCPLSELVIGLKCGGSDAFSGITANPLLGRVSDRLVACGGSTLLTEVPEMFGAETLLLNRCVNEPVFEEAASLVNGFKQYYAAHGQPVYENPSPGNKAGGISTLEEKSLGCTQKGGTSPVVGVIPYGGPSRARGLQLLEGPGNDMVAVTALAAAGAQLILFTTGRGTPLGAPVPTVKISSTSELYERKRGWIDFDAGRLLADATLDGLTEELLSNMLELASGRDRTRNEINGYREIAIFKDGVTL